MPQAKKRIAIDPITQEEWRKVRPHLPDWAQLLFDFMMVKGLRISEALSVERDRIIHDGRRWLVGVQRVKGGPWSQIVVSEPLAKRLQAHRRRGHLRSKKVFPYTKSAAQKALARAAQAAGVRHLHPHQTRHSFAMNYARRPLNISPLEHRIRLRDLLGHKSLESADPYFEPSQEDVLGYWEELAAEEELLTEEEAPARPEPAAKSNPPDSDPFRDIKRHLGLSR